MTNKALNRLKNSLIAIDLGKRLRSFSKQERENIELRCEGMLPAVGTNTLIYGTPGTGKSVMLYELLLGELTKGSCVVLVHLGSDGSRTEPGCWNAMNAVYVETWNTIEFIHNYRFVVIDMREEDGSVMMNDVSFSKLEERLSRLRQPNCPLVFAFDGLESIFEGIRTGKLNEQQVIASFEVLQQRGRVIVTEDCLSECFEREDHATLGRFLRDTSPTIINCFDRDGKTNTHFPFESLTDADRAFFKGMPFKKDSECQYLIKTPGGVFALANLTLTPEEAQFFNGEIVNIDKIIDPTAMLPDLSLDFQKDFLEDQSNELEKYKALVEVYKSERSLFQELVVVNREMAQVMQRQADTCNELYEKLINKVRGKKQKDEGGHA